MAKTIVTFCDRHLGDHDEEVPAVALRVAFGDSAPVEIDLCEECRKELVDPLADFLSEHGQPTVRPKNAAGRTPCPVPGCGASYKQNKGLKNHLATVHADAVQDGMVAGNPVPIGADPQAEGQYACPDCERSFLTPQGVGAHRSRAHGYKSPHTGKKGSKRK